ncbi:MAG: ATP-binding protein [Clostridia bacterium]|nr:ATP-binding protein [Clostridia bacterium]
MNEKMLWVMCGIPGSGKSWVAKHILMRGLGWRYISRDEVRFEIVKDDEEYFSHETKVYNEFIRRIKTALNEEGVFNVIVDATHINWASRRKLLKALGLDGDGVICVVVQNEMDEIIENNESRSGRAVVPRAVVRRMSNQMTDPLTDPIKYQGIMYINNSKKGE